MPFSQELGPFCAYTVLPMQPQQPGLCSLCSQFEKSWFCTCRCTHWHTYIKHQHYYDEMPTWQFTCNILTRRRVFLRLVHFPEEVRQRPRWRLCGILSLLYVMQTAYTKHRRIFQHFNRKQHDIKSCDVSDTIHSLSLVFCYAAGAIMSCLRIY